MDKLLAGQFNGKISPILPGCFYLENYPVAYSVAKVLKPDLEVKDTLHQDLVKTSIAGAIGHSVLIWQKIQNETGDQYLQSLLKGFAKNDTSAD